VRVEWPSKDVQRRLDMTEPSDDAPAVLRMGTSVDTLICDEKLDLDEPEPKRARTAPPSVPPPPCKPASAPQQRRGLNDSARSLTF
jgi:hypothetical protein